MELPCPVCQEPTESLKQYRYPRWVVFLLVGAWWQEEIITACGQCVRRRVWRNCLFNVVPANLLWGFLLLPWAIGLTIASRSRGHSQRLLDSMKAAEAMAQRMQSQRGLPAGLAAHCEMQVREDVSWTRVLALVALVTFWMPLLGLLTTLGAWFVNREVTGWTATVSRVTLWIAALLHGTLAVLFVAALVVEWMR